MIKIIKLLSGAASLLKSFVFGRSWILILAVSLISAGTAATASWKLKDLIDDNTYSVLNQEYTQYKLNVSDSLNSGNIAVIDKMSGLLDNLKDISRQFTIKQQQNKEFSDSLIKELYAENGKSCPLSPAIEHYLDRLRVNQQSRRVN